jgi:hypothetical protein
MRMALAVLSMLVTTWAGCASGLSDRDELIEAVSRFNDDLRWGRWESATVWMAPRARREFLRELPRTTHGGALQTADIEVIGMQPLPGGRAVVRVERSWYLLTDSELRHGLFEQRWEQMDGAWRLTAERQLVARN